MFGIRQIVGGLFGGAAVAALVVVNIAVIPAAVYGFAAWSDLGIWWCTAIVVFGSMFIPFADVIAFGFAIYGTYLYFAN